MARHWAWSAAFSPDGARLAVGYGDGTSEIIELPRPLADPDELARVLACRVPTRIEGDRPVRRVRDSRCGVR